MNLTLHVWRQKDGRSPGGMVEYKAKNVSGDMSFLEMLDVVNEELESTGKEPIAFEHDCREGICGTCGLMINGLAHGGLSGTTTCQLHMRHFKDGDVVYVEPWRANAFPMLRDLMVDRTALDKIIQAGGYVSVDTGGAPDGNLIPIPKPDADAAFDTAQCIACGACVAACPNASAMLYTAAKVAHLARLPQGRIERSARVVHMVDAMDEAGFGNCSNHSECEAACPKEIRMESIALMNREYLRAQAMLNNAKESTSAGGF